MQNFFAELTLTMPDACHSNDRFGIIFRAPDSSKGYLYGLTCNGRYFLSGWNGETYFTIIDYSENWLIQTSPGATNRLGILVQENSYALYANGSLLDHAIDDTFLEEGMLGYFISAASDQPFTVSYDDVAIWSLIR